MRRVARVANLFRRSPSDVERAADCGGQRSKAQNSGRVHRVPESNQILTPAATFLMPQRGSRSPSQAAAFTLGLKPTNP
jgi:hypothetical protein